MQKPKIPNNKTKKTQPQTSSQHFKYDSRPKTYKTLKKEIKVLASLTLIGANVRGRKPQVESTRKPKYSLGS